MTNGRLLLNGNDSMDTSWVLAYILLCISFVVAPCVFSPNVRIKWKRRIQQRRWDPEMNEGDDRNNIFESMARRNREMALIALEIRQSHENEKISSVVRRFDDFSMKIQPENIMSADDVTKSSTNLSLAAVDEVLGGESSDAKDIVHEGCNYVCVPCPGVSRTPSDRSTYSDRCVPNNCAICLSNFTCNDSNKLVWSSNPQCVHVYHHSCLVGWTESVVKRKVVCDTIDEENANSVTLDINEQNNPVIENSRTDVNNTDEVTSDVDLVNEVSEHANVQTFKNSLSLPCPNCRRDFVLRISEA